MKIRIRRVVEGTLLLGGVACLGIWGWAVVREQVYEDWNNWAFDREAARQEVSLREWLKYRVTGTKPHQPAPQPNAPVARPAPRRETDENFIGRLTIPRLNLQAVVREGTAEKTLSVALGHVQGTAKPGQNGNVGVAGHRDSLFRGLRNIGLNDQIILETPAGDTYTYQVMSMKTVKPADVSVLSAGLYPELTLVTCYPFNYVGSAPDRFIVKARQIGQVMQSPATEIAEAKQPETVAPAPAAPVPVPAAAQPAPAATPVATQTDNVAAARAVATPAKRGTRRVPFELATKHSRQLAPGISIGITKADAENKTVDGWMWVMPDRRTIWLRDQRARRPIVVYGSDGVRREVVIDSVTRNSVRGYLLL